MKIALLNDTHCGTRNSSDIFLDNAEKFYDDVFFPCLLERGINHIVHLGDYYDNRKFINFRALNRNRNHFLKPLSSSYMLFRKNLTVPVSLFKNFCTDRFESDRSFYPNTNGFIPFSEKGYALNDRETC